MSTKDEIIELSRLFKIPIYIITNLTYNEAYDLEEIAESSGGQCFFIKDMHDLEKIYMDVFELQKEQIYVTYNSQEKGDWAQVKLEYDTDSHESDSKEEDFFADKSSEHELIDNNIIQSITASSHRPGMSDRLGSYTYFASHAIDGNHNTAWVEGAPGFGIGEWIQLDFSRNYTVKGIDVLNGYKKREDLYVDNSRIKDLRVRFSDNTYEDFTLSDRFIGSERVEFSYPKTSTYIRLEILSVYEGNRYPEDTCVTDLSVF